MAFLLIFALSSMVAIAPSSMMMAVDASSKFSTTPAFHKKIELKQRRNSRNALSTRSLEQRKAFLLNYRGGGDEDEKSEGRKWTRNKRKRKKRYLDGSGRGQGKDRG